jgi:cytochrome c-type biogenesis protein CcmE
MNKKYIIGIAVAAVFIIVAVLAIDSNAIEYANFDDAIGTNKTVQVTGSWIKQKPTKYDPANNLFVFYMKDKKNKEVKVIFNGPKPQNFNIANYFVVTGKFKNDVFYATDILTKCPSKYEGQIDDLKKAGNY